MNGNEAHNKLIDKIKEYETNLGEKPRATTICLSTEYELDLLKTKSPMLKLSNGQSLKGLKIDGYTINIDPGQEEDIVFQ